MRRIFWQIHTTLDGFMEDPEGNLTYTAEVADPDFEKYASEMLAQIDGYIIGRKTYEMFVDYWPKAEGPDAEILNSLPKYVVSTTLESADWNNAQLIKENVVEEIRNLKKETGKDMAVFGSAALASSLIAHGLIDEYRFLVSPFVIGEGGRTFKNIMHFKELRLTKSEAWSSGTVALFYSTK